jgi:thioredoxin 1
MDRWIVVLLAAAGLAGAWLAWQGIKGGLRRGVRGEAGDRPALLYFHSDDCAPCRYQQAPAVAALQRALGERVRFEEIDALARPELARRYRVFTLPTTVVVAADGRVAAVNYGVASADRLRAQLAEALATPR